MTFMIDDEIEVLDIYTDNSDFVISREIMVVAPERKQIVNEKQKNYEYIYVCFITIITLSIIVFMITSILC